jgi:predicted ATPase
MFLIGPNASGKSNLLDVFRFLRDVAKPGGGFQRAVMDRGGVSSLRCLAARKYSDIAIEVEAGDSATTKQEPQWKYRIQFNQDRQRNPLLKKEQVWKGDKQLLERPDKHDEADPPRLTQTYMEQVNANREFRELANFLEAVRYLHLVPHIIRDPQRFMPRRDDPFGSDFLEKLASAKEPTLRARLSKISEALKVVVPQFQRLEVSRDNRGTPHLRALYEHWRPTGAYQDEKLFSDGTLRFMGFLWSLLEGQGPLLLEEPELSLHPGVVRPLASVIWRLQRAKKPERQVLVSTHSWDLVSDHGIGGDEVLMLTPSKEGTRVQVGKDDEQIRALLEAGLSVADAVIPATEPKNAQQLYLSF